MNDNAERALLALAKAGHRGYAAMDGDDVVAVIGESAVDAIKRGAWRRGRFWINSVPYMGGPALLAAAFVAPIYGAWRGWNVLAPLAATAALFVRNVIRDEAALAYVAMRLSEQVPVLRGKSIRLVRVPVDEQQATQ